MKRSLFALVTALAAFIIGCQNPDVNNPASTDNTNVPAGIGKPHPQPYEVPDPGQIQFKQEVLYTNSDTKHEAMQASGIIYFSVRQSPILSREAYDVLLEVKGEIRSSGGNAAATSQWTFGGSTKDQISISKLTKTTFVKQFTVQGTEVPTVLTATFVVTSNTLALRTMSLTEVKISPGDNNVDGL